MAILPSRGRPNTTSMRKKTFTANVSRPIDRSDRSDLI